MSNIIATYAQLANGKDTLCDYLADALPKEKTWERGAFANAVKDTYCNAFGVSREFIENWKRNPEPPPGMLMNVRKGLQFIGDGFRQIVPSIWIDIALRSKDNLIISGLVPTTVITFNFFMSLLLNFNKISVWIRSVIRLINPKDC